MKFLVTANVLNAATWLEGLDQVPYTDSEVVSLTDKMAMDPMAVVLTFNLFEESIIRGEIPRLIAMVKARLIVFSVGTAEVRECSVC